MGGLGVNIAVAQFAPGPDSHTNAAGLARLAEDAHRQGAEIMVAPEYSQSFSPGGGAAWAHRAQADDGEFVTALAELSAGLDGLVIVAGMLVSGRSELPVNTIVVITPEGVVARAEKLHLYDAFGVTESRFVAPGGVTPPQIFHHGELRLGLQACYDLRFPEVTRALVDAGANTLAVPAQWVPGPHKVFQWQTLLRARAIEAQCFVVAAGQPPPHGIGHSALLDPEGQSLIEAGDEPCVVVAEVIPELVGEIRAANPMATARRFGVVPL